MDYVIEGARAVIAGGLEDASVSVSTGIIASLDASGSGRRIDGRGLVLAPAIIDIHGDAFERQMMPRPGIFFPTEAAILETDRQLAGNGIATAYHALTLSWEPGLRSVEHGRALIDGLHKLAPRLTVENRVQLRWETFAFEAVDLIREALQAPLTPALAFNDHTTISMRAIGMPVTERPFALSAEETASLDDPRLHERCESAAKRAGLAVADYVALMGTVWRRRGDVPAMIETVAQAGNAAGAPMLSHDDTMPEIREHFSRLGARIAEFPMSEATAHHSRERGEWSVLGAPNVVRGGSHVKSLNAADMVQAGLCNILASDYYYPTMLAAISRMVTERRGTLPVLWELISSNPAAALGLHDRGRIDPG
ncbi:MAG: alpha-D-ribose 1-methylphosphonate 5-triphosphate diphosphatase, partial [Pseudomonadota bacterium]